MPKITIIGAGAVGATAAQRSAEKINSAPMCASFRAIRMRIKSMSG